MSCSPRKLYWYVGVLVFVLAGFVVGGVTPVQAVICPDACPTVDMSECLPTTDSCGCSICGSPRPLRSPRPSFSPRPSVPPSSTPTPTPTATPTPTPTATPTPTPTVPPLTTQAWFAQDESARNRIDVFVSTGSTPSSRCLPESDWNNVNVYDVSNGISSPSFLGKMSSYAVAKSDTFQPWRCGGWPEGQVPPSLDGTMYRFAGQTSNLGSFRDSKNQFARKGYFPTLISFDISGKAPMSAGMKLFQTCQSDNDCSVGDQERCYQPSASAPKVCIVRSDLDFNGKIEMTDYTIMANSFFSTGQNMKTDINNDGLVDILDYSILSGDL